MINKVLAIILLFMPVVTLATAYKPFVFYPSNGIHDKSFGASAYKGVKAFKKDYAKLQAFYHTKKSLIIKWKAKPSSPTMTEEVMVHAAQQGFNPIISVGFDYVTTIQKVAPKFKKTTFIIIDSPMDAKKYPNVISYVFKEQEGGYLAGVLAAYISKTNKVGFVGAMQIRPIMRFSIGYRQGVAMGAQLAHKHVTMVNPVFIGNTVSAFTNVSKAKILSVNLYNSNVDVIFAAAGLASTGVLQASGEYTQRMVYSIGVDSNQDDVAPGHVLTSIIKAVNLPVYEALALGYSGKLTKIRKGVQTIGLKGLFLHGSNIPLFVKKYVNKYGFYWTKDSYNSHVLNAHLQKILTSVSERIKHPSSSNGIVIHS